MKCTYFRLLLSILLFTSCQEETLVRESPIISSAKNPTVQELKIKLREEVSVQVKVKQLSNGKVRYTMPTTESLEHDIMLAGLKPDEWHTYQVLADGKEITQPDSFKTADIPSGIVHIETHKNIENAFEGYILTQRRLVKGSVYMLDAEGDVVWYQSIPGQPKLSTLTEEGNVLVLYGNARHSNSAGDKIVCYSLSGEIVYEVDLSRWNMVAHHEVLAVENDLAVLVYDTLTIQGANNEQIPVASSAIVRMTRQGEVKWKWSIFDTKHPAEDPNVQETFKDWGHTNAFSFDGEHLLVSQRDWNQIWKVHPGTGELDWILGEEGTLTMDGLETGFSGQHAIHKTTEGNYMLFDNGREVRKSRLLEFSISEDHAEPTEIIELSDDLYADRMGNVQWLPGGKLLVCSPRSRSIVVTGSQGEMRFHATVGIPDPYRVEWVPPFYTDRP